MLPFTQDTAETPAVTEPATPKISQVEAIKRTVDHFGGPDSPEARSNQKLAEYIKTNYGIDVSPQYISVQKNNMRKEDKGGSSPSSPTPVTDHHIRLTASEPAENGVEDPSSSAFTLDAAMDVKALVKRHGAEKVKALLRLFE